MKNMWFYRNRAEYCLRHTFFLTMDFFFFCARKSDYEIRRVLNNVIWWDILIPFFYALGWKHIWKIILVRVSCQLSRRQLNIWSQWMPAFSKTELRLQTHQCCFKLHSNIYFTIGLSYLVLHIWLLTETDWSIWETNTCGSRRGHKHFRNSLGE